MHKLVRDTIDVDVAEVACDAFKCPVFRAYVLAGRTRPEDAVDVTCACGVREAIPLRGDHSRFFALKNAEGIYARRTVTMGPQGVNVAQEGGIRGTILELSRGI